AMANFAGGMAKGFAKGAIFNAVMAGASYLASGAGQQPAEAMASNSAKEVTSEHGTSDTDGHTNSGSYGRPLNESERAALSKDLDQMNERVSKLDNFKTHEKAAEWLHDNALSLTETHGAELYARIYEHAGEGFSIGKITTSFHTGEVSVEAMSLSKSFKLFPERAADWHTHPSEGAANFSAGDYSGAFDRYVSFKDYYRDPGLRHYDGRAAWKAFGHSPRSPAAPKMPIEFGDKYSRCIKGGC
ncbi:MAG: hypothetical protein R3359_12875, partial [Marinirhabdus sp.]|nr:hypothetical protein [Marinirhabdus sp.]